MPSVSKKRQKTRQEINEQCRRMKRLRKRKGLHSGSRHNTHLNQQATTSANQPRDPRVGSKKPIPLVAEAPLTIQTQQPVQPKLSKEQELQQLENDPRLEQLLDKIDQQQILTDTEQDYVDRALDRIDALMSALGYLDDEETDQDSAAQDDIMALLRKR